MVEEFKHNTDATDPFAWQPQTPSRARASALVAACAALARQDMPAAVAGTPRAYDADVPVACPKQRQQEQAVRDYVQQPSPCAEPGCRAAMAAPCQLPAEGVEQPNQPEERAPDQAAAAMDVELELSGEPATPLGSPRPARPAAAGRDAFSTPAQQVMRCGSVEFPALDASAAATPALCTPTLTPAVKWRAPLWKKLHLLSLDFLSQVHTCASTEHGDHFYNPLNSTMLPSMHLAPSPLPCLLQCTCQYHMRLRLATKSVWLHPRLRGRCAAWGESACLLDVALPSRSCWYRIGSCVTCIFGVVQQAEQALVSKGSSAAATPAPGSRQQAFAAAAALPSPARAHVADAAALVSAAFKGRHGLEGRRLELSSSCAADEPGAISSLMMDRTISRNSKSPESKYFLTAQKAADCS